ncbi:hypothetical protein BD309DRAFT_1022005 [Dichomitus squalens]|uniref:protein-tyrosine-phosphatase n=1 Tax=Dichomitus squalens TaxID=114155 RepID=A0A4Q9PLG3_9APHY|nr:hypothetical protein BD309DRAFT_1022005 [Dichomitus squalens]TBU55002.1 hypothetical protein BD310DRAFT_951066 [Dichomitus squalens]
MSLASPQQSPTAIPQPPIPPLSLPSMPSSSALGAPSSSAALTPSAFVALPPSSLPAVLSDSSALILDIRPHNSYTQARIPDALSLCVPSTLLKRPNFPLARLADMLPTTAARDKFSKWHQASRILVYDADSAALPPTSNLLGLMRKFRSEGFPDDREIAWLRSGFHAVWREHPDLVDRRPPSEELDEDEHSGEPETDGDPAPLGMTKTMSAPGSARVLRAKHLPKAAFTSASTIPFRPKGIQPPPNTAASAAPFQVVPPTPAVARENPFSASGSSALPLATSVVTVPPPLAGASMSGPPASGRSSGRAEFSLRLPPGSVRPRHGGAAGTMKAPSGPLYSMPTLSPQRTSLGAYREPSFSLPGRQVAFNPFFDTIRQNLELGSRDAKNPNSEGIPLKLPRRVRRRVGELPFEWLRQIARKSRHVTESSSTDDGDIGSDSGSPSSDPKVRPVSEQPPLSNMPLPPLPSRVPESTMAHRSPQGSPLSSPSPPLPEHPGRTARRSSMGSHRSSSSDHSHSPSDADDLTRALESQFYQIELSEQKRLLGVMERHSAESGKVIQEGPGVRGVAGIPSVSGSESEAGKGTSAGTRQDGQSAAAAAAVGEDAVASFPFSITAGLEKGSKNRYRNIWPFEHARVRLRKAKPDDDDYMNASYVQPLGTTKRYIATQGPLATTFVDFWTLCWEQNVHVIVMLTREIEGSSVKCGKYWEEGTYGPLRLKLIETNDTPERERKRQESEIGGGFFSQHLQQQVKPKPKRKVKSNSRGKRDDGDVEMNERDDEDDESTIKRVFELTNTAYPLASPRIVTQFQYLDWPDLNVPDDPRGVLHLMHRVDEAVEASRKADQGPWGEGPLYRTDAPLHGNTVVTGKYASVDAIDPITGVSMLAKDNPPVLLHCSAGVGRTGGFIAVDAVLDGVRREMRKRREGFVQETAAAQAASEYGPVRSRSGSGRSRSHSHSQSRSRDMSVVSPTPEREVEQNEAMEVDPSPPRLESETKQLTMPVSVGGREVHVPVAGFAESVPMEVDEQQREDEQMHPSTAADKKTTSVPPSLLKASPELVEEVRRAAITALTATSMGSSYPSTTNQRMGSARPVLVGGLSEVSSDSHFTHAGSHGTMWSRSLHSSSTPSTNASQTDTSTNSMVGQTAKLSMSSPSPPPSGPSAEATSFSGCASAFPTVANLRLRATSLGSEASPKPTGELPPPTKPSKAAHSYRLDTWRSEVQSSADSSSRKSGGVAPSLAAQSQSHADKDEAGDASSGEETAHSGSPSPPLKAPRKLHDDTSPPLLSSYDEPIRKVVEDMREQRMSLCQSLRQYVFVHRAIIEGALMIVDEEKRRKKAEDAKRRASAGGVRSGEDEQRSAQASSSGGASGVSLPLASPTSAQSAPGARATNVPQALRLGSSFSPSSSDDLSSRGGELPRKRSAPNSSLDDHVEALTSMSMSTSMPELEVDTTNMTLGLSSPGRAKRGASPTELLMEGLDGGLLLTKRPSLKRHGRQRTGDAEMFQSMGAMMAGSPPSAPAS